MLGGGEQRAYRRLLDDAAALHYQGALAVLGYDPEVVESAAENYEPPQVAYYLRNLANDFHTYYNAHNFLAAEPNLRRARIALIDATRQVLANGLDLIGVHAPSKM